VSLDIQHHLAVINSATKYPSIPTYHAMADRGRLSTEVQVAFEGAVAVSEKIDGTNARIVVIPRVGTRPLYLIGSREELLTASGDLVSNPAMGIVAGIRAHAERALELPLVDTAMLVIWGELYGGRVTAASKHYTTTQATGFAVFDVARFTVRDIETVLESDSQTIAAWRDRGEQPFTEQQVEFATAIGAATVPHIGSIAPPAEIEAAYGWLRVNAGDVTRAALDAAGRPEGVVVRDSKRRIAKLRFEDYERTLKAAR
jgi:RNA ligase